MRPGTFLGNTLGDVACGACLVELQCGNRAARSLCGNGCHVRATCGLRGGDPSEGRSTGRGTAPLPCSLLRSPVHETRTRVVGGAVRADPGLRCQVVRMEQGGGYRRRRSAHVEAFVRTRWHHSNVGGWAPHSMPFPWRIAAKRLEGEGGAGWSHTHLLPALVT